MVELLTRIDPIVGFLSIISIVLIFVGFLLKRIKQPYIIGYIAIGVAIGEHGLDIVTDKETIHHLGEIGILLLLFFIGMEISLPKLVSQWRVAAIGTFLQVLISILIILGIGFIFGWQIQRVVLLGFVIALSSSAVIIRLLEEQKLIHTKIGQNVLSILLTQDMIIVPMLIITSFMGGEEISTTNIVLMVTGGFLFLGLLAYIYKTRKVVLPYSKLIWEDHELQVFLAVIFCFGGALVTSVFGLSPALGAFAGGLYLHGSSATRWIHDTLHAFRVIFVAVFFASIGLQLDFAFIWENFKQIFIVLLAVYLTNHLVNTLILRFFKNSWVNAILGGAYLAQIGELSFLLASTSFYLDIIGEFEYKFTISLISLTLLISPFWIEATNKILQRFQEKLLIRT